MTTALTRESITDEFEQIDSCLDVQLDATLLGGGALVLRGYKDTTHDIDLSVTSRSALDRLTEGLRELGYQQVLYQEVGSERYPLISLARGDGREMHVGTMQFGGDLLLTPSVLERSDRFYDGHTFRVQVLSIEDIYLRKLVAGRLKDTFDTMNLNDVSLDHDIIRTELAIQRELLDIELPNVVLR